MLRTQLPITLLLLSVLSLGCTDSGTPVDSAINTANPTSTNPTSNGSPATGLNMNGPHTGEIWTPSGSSYVGTTRFNLQTGVKVKLTDTWAFPTLDGSKYVEVDDEVDREHHPNCNFLSVEDVNQFSVKDTRTGATLGEFRFSREFGFPVRLSPDAERLALRAEEEGVFCNLTSTDTLLTVMSKDGEVLYRHHDDSVLSYDWHPDGRLVILVKYPEGWANRYGLQMETAPGSLVFTLEGLFSWNRASDVVGYGGFRVSPNGKEAVLEEILDQAHFLSGATWRNARTRHFKMFEVAEETAMFVYEDGQPRVNSPVFSPDGQHIMVVEGDASAAVVLNPTSLEIDSFDFNSVGGTDELGTFSVEAVATPGMAYIVPASQKLQPMPPKQFSDNIRPVFARGEFGGSKINTIGFSAAYDFFWTPVVE